jgi:flagellar biosynthesis component FlhA
MSKLEKSIFAQFDERKQAVKTESLKDEHTKLDQQQEISTESINSLTDADMPDIDTLNEESDYSMFMSSKVSEILKKKALRKLFLSPSINILDGLNDYDENYTTFELLGDIIPHELKQQIEREKKKAEEEILEEKQKEQEENLDPIVDETQSTNNETLTTKNNDSKHKQSSETASN